MSDTKIKAAAFHKLRSHLWLVATNTKQLRSGFATVKVLLNVAIAQSTMMFGGISRYKETSPLGIHSRVQTPTKLIHEPRVGHKPAIPPLRG